MTSARPSCCTTSRATTTPRSRSSPASPWGPSSRGSIAAAWPCAGSWPIGWTCSVAEQDRGSDDPQLAAIARHALHDEELIVAFAAGDVEDRADAERARALVERCAKCHELQRDVSAIRAAMQVSGTAAQRAQTRRAPRDFRLTAEDAARLRPGSPVTRLAVRLGWRDRVNLGLAAFGRPVGA